MGGPGWGGPWVPRFLPRQAGLLPTPLGSPGCREGGTGSPSVRLPPRAQKVGGGKTKPPQMKLSQCFICESSHGRSPVVFRSVERVWGGLATPRLQGVVGWTWQCPPTQATGSHRRRLWEARVQVFGRSEQTSWVCAAEEKRCSTLCLGEVRTGQGTRCPWGAVRGPRP